MSRTVQVLPDAVANQIAAGEVVERPASVVKELVENALDAGARRVDVHLLQGGKREIRVADDGSGMGRPDALLSLDRHATSKIRSADDLKGVRSFGFRGEALPSIASVSRLTLETWDGEGVAGTRIAVRGGMVLEVADHPRTQGTTVLVERLFWNAPARAAFLKTPAAETRAVQDALIPLALAYPEVGFFLSSDATPLLELPKADDLVGRIAQIWGEEAAGELLPVHRSGAGMELRGVIQRPDRVRPGIRRAHLFVATRPFRDPALLRAADRGYRTTIPEGYRPWIFLALELPGGSVDVNVHPTKAEVRFRRKAEVEALVEEAVREALAGLESAATLDSAPQRPLLPPLERGERAAPLIRERAPSTAGTETQFSFFMPEPTGSSEGGESEGTLTHPMEVEGFEHPRLWQVHRRWSLAEVRDGILLIDQHAAHERILFEEIMAGFDGRPPAGQRLLFPLTVRLTPAEVRMVEDLKGLLHRAGFEVEPFGESSVILHAVPNPHPHFNPERVFLEMMEELTHGSELVRSARNQHERLAMSFACKAAIKAGQPLDAREIQELFDRLFATRLPFHDVHGRPTTVRLSRGELERKFGR